MKILLPLLLVATSLLAAVAHGDDGRFAVNGRGVVFGLGKPSGWEMDSDGGRSDGLAVVYYRSGQSWGNAPVVMYVNSVPKACEASSSLAAFIDLDLKQSKAKNPKLQIEDGSSILVDGKKATVKLLSGDRFGNYEAIAYLGEEDVFLSFTLSAKSEPMFKEAYPAFVAMVSSYQLGASRPGCTE